MNYDPNGNIAFYNRHGNSGTNVDMDSMLYRYLPGTNKLDHVDDAVPASNYSVDIDDQDTLNYRYDQIGNLTRDTSEGIDSIKWTLYGKIQEIDKHNGDTIRFAYDPAGHRIMKEVYIDSTHHKKGNYYVQDVSGNMMATYEWQDRDTFKLNDVIIYGNKRLGSIDLNLLMCDTINNDSVTNASRALTGSSLTNGVVYHTYGIKQYELSNHLGNVLATITDRHIPVYSGSVLSYYKADVASAQDYYPFGMQMPGRIFNGRYRFGFNGQEKDDEIEGNGSSNTADFWEYDTRLGRRWNTDPVEKSRESPYLCFSGNPVFYSDPTGADDGACDSPPSPQEGGVDQKPDASNGKTTVSKGDNGDITVTAIRKKCDNTSSGGPTNVVYKGPEYSGPTAYQEGTLWKNDMGAEAIMPKDQKSMSSGWIYVGSGIYNTENKTNMVRLMKNSDFAGLSLPKTKDDLKFEKCFQDGGRDAVIGLGAGVTAPFAIGYAVSMAPVVGNGIANTSLNLAARAYLRWQVFSGAVVGGSSTIVLLGRNMKDVINPMAEELGYTTITRTLPALQSLSMPYNQAWLQFHLRAGSTILMHLNSISTTYGTSPYMQMEIQDCLDYFSK